MVNERARGELIIEHLGAYDVVAMYDQPEALRMGVFDCLSIFIGTYSKLQSEIQSISFSQIEPWEERERGFFDFMVEQHEKINMRYLGRHGSMAMQRLYILLNERVEKPADLAGMKFASGAVYLPFAKALDVSTVVLPMAEKYTALERGVIDGNFQTSILNVVGFSFYEVCKYILDPSISVAETVVLMNLDKWNSLPKHLQDLLNEAVVELERDTAVREQKAVEDGIQKAKDEGMEFIYFSPEDEEWFRNTYYDVCWSEWVEKKVSAETYAKLRKLVSK